jgi:hypothetical protein
MDQPEFTSEAPPFRFGLRLMLLAFTLAVVCVAAIGVRKAQYRQQRDRDIERLEGYISGGRAYVEFGVTNEELQGEIDRLRAEKAAE